MFVKFHPGQTVDHGFEAEYSVSTPTPTTSPPTTKTAATSETETTNESETTSEPETTNESETTSESINKSGMKSGKYPMNFLCNEYSKLINAFCYKKVKLLRPTFLMIPYR